MKVLLDGQATTVRPTQLLATGGEADVYDLGDGRVLKLWKTPDHPDLIGDPAAIQAAGARLAEQQHKLPALRARALPPIAVRPTAVATTTRGGPICGYAMPRVDGEVLHTWSDPRFRRAAGLGLADALRVLGELAAAFGALHRAGVVIGDVSDLNVLVSPTTVRLVDVDSWQLEGFLARTWTERFVDPRLCVAQGGQLVMARPHDEGSDWFGLAVLACRLLLGIAPYAGVYAPGGSAPAIAPALRPLHGLSIFDPHVRLPAWVGPLDGLPPALLAWLRTTLGDVATRTPPPDHRTLVPGAGASSPPRAAPPAQIVVGTLRADRVAPHLMPVGATPLGPAPGPHGLSLLGGTVWRHASASAQPIGTVLGAAAHLLVTAGGKLAGLYRVGALTVGITADVARGGLSDGVRLPTLRGHLLGVHAASAGERVWLSWRCLDRDQLRLGVAVIERHRLIATNEVTLAASGGAAEHEPDSACWQRGLPGACAVGELLLVPTDRGIARLGVSSGAIVVERWFDATRDLCCHLDELAPAPAGLYLRRAADVLHLQLSA
jgi:hypothetical protein